MPAAMITLEDVADWKEQAEAMEQRLSDPLEDEDATQEALQAVRNLLRALDDLEGAV